MVKKHLYIVCLIFISKTSLTANVNDSIRNHFFEISYFKAPTLKSGIFKINQRGINLKISFKIAEIKKISISLNPFYTNLTNVLYRGNFSERPAIEAYASARIRADAYGIGIGIEKKINKKMTIRTEFGISNTANSLFSRRDRLFDSITNCINPNDSGYYINLSNYKEIKLGYYASISIRYKLNPRLSLSLGYLYRTTNYDVSMLTFYYTCGFSQQYNAIMRPSVSNLTIGLCYNFSLEKFK